MKRHSRSETFERSRTEGHQNVSNWMEIDDDPNHPRAVAQRSRTLATAWRAPIADRIGFLEDRVRGPQRARHRVRGP